ncbi:MAG TPA: L,D-transpeptidase family protein, partial [Geobacteraceae bacterium]
MKKILFLAVAAVLIPATLAVASLQQADRVVVMKKERLLLLICNGEVLRSYRVALGKNPVGPKTRQGDRKTPEGSYVVDYRKSQSRFYKALHI